MNTRQQDILGLLEKNGEMTIRAHEACRAEKTLLLIEDATHGTSYLKEPETCRQALSGFLKKYTREG